jgi:hypothetical protein
MAVSDYCAQPSSEFADDYGLLGSTFSGEGIADEMEHMAACDNTVPGLSAGHAGKVASECSVIFAREEKHLHGNSLLS